MDYDDIDMLSPVTPAQFYALSAPVVNVPPNLALRSSTRPRPSLSVAVAEKQPRKRTLSTSALQNATPTHTLKKAKLDEKKVQTHLTNAKRETRDRARKKWIYCHRALIEPLLPSNSSFFDNLEREIRLLGEKEAPSFVPLHGLDEQPKLVQGGFMKDYQLHGLSFLVSMYKNGMNCILGDEMGLGKTLQTLSLFAYINENSPGTHDPHLVICPLSVLSSWQTEAARWVPSMRVIRLHGSASERNRIKESTKGDRAFDIMLTTYETYVLEDSWFKSRRWTYCVLDEGHKIKNSDTNIALKVQTLGSLFRLILTGTPVQNNLLELWGLLHWLYPSLFTDASERLFKDSFDLSQGSYSIPFLNASSQLLSTIMLRRIKAAVVGDEIPPREELTVFIPLTDMQRFWTYRLLTKMDMPDLQEIFIDKPAIKLEDETTSQKQPEATVNSTAPAGSGAAEGNQWKKLMNILMQLRKVCDHPYLLPNAEPEPRDIAEHIVSASSKTIVIDKILADVLPKGERCGGGAVFRWEALVWVVETPGERIWVVQENGRDAIGEGKWGRSGRGW